MFIDVIRDIISAFRFAKYIATQSRPAEKETIKNFIQLIRPVIERSAEKAGYSVVWGQPSFVIRNNGEMWSKNAMLRQNVSMASISTVDLVFQHQQEKDKKFTTTITINNNIRENEITYSTPASDSLFGRRYMMPLDYCLREGRLREDVLKGAYIAISLALLTEEKNPRFMTALKKEAEKKRWQSYHM